ncbi:MAG: DUF29 domain-containing protein [Alphaproteobacteria bacterium]|nr:DUF29 domain-containing protein [Alphaproteobacteria bacterium]
MNDLYDLDVYSWAMKQADALRRRSANEVDWDNVAEEIEGVGKCQAAELHSRYVVLLAHLLKWMLQPDLRGRSWEASIRIQRLELARHLAENPGLKPRRDETFGGAYQSARLVASGEMDIALEALSETNPFTLAETMDDGFWPERKAPL